MGDATQVKLTGQRFLVGSLGFPWPKLTMHLYSRAYDRMREFIGFHRRRLGLSQTPVNPKAFKFAKSVNRRGPALQSRNQKPQNQINRRDAKSAEKSFRWTSTYPSRSPISKHLEKFCAFFVFSALFAPPRLSRKFAGFHRRRLEPLTKFSAIFVFSALFASLRLSLYLPFREFVSRFCESTSAYS